jgi:aerobic carbon-monoxide dehydrogenase medium subunit
MLPAFRLARPRTLDEALDAIGDEKVPYCGGTELLLAMRAGLHRPETLVDLKKVADLSGVRQDGDVIVIGAIERHMDLAVQPLLQRHLPMLATVEGAVGNARVRAQGSVGGNLCFAEPKSDVATALVAYCATVTLVGPGGRHREVAVEDFVAGPYWADKEPDELLLDVRVPIPSHRTRAVYLKYQTAERPTVGVALLYNGATGCRLVVGAVGEVQMLFTFGDPAEIDPEAVAAELDPTPDLTGSDRYKRHVAATYIRRAVHALAEAA